MARKDRLVRQYLRDRFVVTIKAGQVWSGILLDADDHTFLLADVEVIGPDGATKAEGQVFVSRADVAYMQRT